MPIGTGSSSLPALAEVLNAFNPSPTGGAAQRCADEAANLQRNSDTQARTRLRNLFLAGSWEEYRCPLSLAERQCTALHFL